MAAVNDPSAPPGDDRDAPAVYDHVLSRLDRLEPRLVRDLYRCIGEAHPGFAERYPGWRGSHGRALQQIPPEGASLTAVAAIVGVTKQSLAETIRGLTDMGLVESRPDPADRRGVVIRRTAEGRRLAADVHAAILAMQDGWAAQVGARRLATFLAVLGELGGLDGHPGT